ncbi:MAG: protein translocase subunit SecF [Actinobacteria bacterium]|nr:protein translocase subunit SecF [Actinomycetota bacterium]
MSKLTVIGQRLYRGEVSFNFVGRWKTWYIVSGVILLISVGALVGRGLNLGIEFKGGADFSLPAATCSVEDARAVSQEETGAQTIVTITGSGTVRVQTETLTPAESSVLAGLLAEACGIEKDDIKYQVVGPTWGAEISAKALQGLGVFLLLVTLFLTLYFEWRMALSALVALAHDLLITIGIYALIGLEVTPATVIGVLTILGYSLYDTVVVFDKVKENTRGITGQSVLTYNEAANLAVNQTLIRSINTSIVALLPVLSIIFVGAFLLGAGTLLDLAVALAIGMAAGTYSSIFVATPVLAQLKSATPEMKSLSNRVLARRGQAQRKNSDSGQEGVDKGSLVGSRTQDPSERRQPRKVPRSKRKRG